MRFGLLGTATVCSGGELVPVRWPVPRSVLAVLLLNANRVVSTERLIDVVWGDDPPASALASLQNHVMRLRALLAGAGPTRIMTIEPGPHRQWPRLHPVQPARAGARALAAGPHHHRANRRPPNHRH